MYEMDIGNDMEYFFAILTSYGIKQKQNDDKIDYFLGNFGILNDKDILKLFDLENDLFDTAKKQIIHNQKQLKMYQKY